MYPNESLVVKDYDFFIDGADFLCQLPRLGDFQFLIIFYAGALHKHYT
jgi:hypothetical protein